LRSQEHSKAKPLQANQIYRNGWLTD